MQETTAPNIVQTNVVSTGMQRGVMTEPDKNYRQLEKGNASNKGNKKGTYMKAFGSIVTVFSPLTFRCFRLELEPPS